MPDDFTGFLNLARARNHNAGRLLEAYAWTILEIQSGHLRLECHVPDQVLNLGGTLFGGFTPTYVDMIAIWTCMTTMAEQMVWLSTVNMRVDYLEPIRPPRFHVDSRLVNVRRRDYLVETRFIEPTNDDEPNDDEPNAAGQKMLAFAITTLKKADDRPLH